MRLPIPLSSVVSALRGLALPVACAVFFGLAATAGAEELRIRVGLDLADIFELNEADASRLSFPGAGVLRDFGRPRLPVQTIDVLIPRDRVVASARLVGGEIRSLGTPSNMALDAGVPVPDMPLLRETVFADLEVEASALYPPVELRLTGDRYQHGYHLVGIEIYPIREDRSSGELQLRVNAELVLELVPKEATGIVQREREIPGWRDVITRRIAANVINPEAIEGYAIPPSIEVGAAKLAPPLSQKTPSLATSPVQFLIVTDAAFVGEFQRLADHRQKLGMPSLVVSFDEITANYRHGLDFAETIRMYITDAYSKWGVDYVLLGGDTGVLPVRYAHSTFYPPASTTDIPSDMYFSCLDGNWNADGDALFGEVFVSGSNPGDNVDLAPEVTLGRAPVATLAEAELFVDKVIEFEMPTNLGYQSSALFASEVLFPSSWSLGQTIQLDGASYSEDIVNSMFPCDPYASWTSTRYYENFTAYPGSVEELKASVLASLNAGNYGLFNHIGHGFYFDMSVGDFTIRVEDTINLQNGPNYYVLYALNCSSAAFDFGCILERFLKSSTGGSVASIGSARSAFPNMSNNFQQEFYNAWFCGGATRLGDAIDASRLPFTGNTFLNTSERWTHFCYAVLGDPSMRLWSSAPRAVSLALPTSTTPGVQNHLITVTDVLSTNPLEGATVCLSKGGEDYAVGTTDVSGQVNLSFDAETLGNIDVWVSGMNAMPASAAIAVVDPAAIALSVEGMSFADDGSAGSIGNGNGRLEAGERIAITPLIRNDGSVAFGGGNVTLSSIDANLSVVNATAAVGGISAGGNLLASSALTVDLSVNMPDAHEAILEFVMDDGGLANWPDTETLLFDAPELEMLRVSFDDAAQGNGNGIIEIGEPLEIIVEVKNFGGGAIGSVSAVLSSGDPDVSISDASSVFGALPGVLSVSDNDADRFVVVENNVGQANVFNLTLTDDQGRVLPVSFDLRKIPGITGLAQGIGQSGQVLLSWDASTSLQLLGYRVYRRDVGGSTWELGSPDIITGSATYRDEGLAPLTAFEYSVVTVDVGWLESDLSPPLEASTPPNEVSCFPLPIGLDTSADLAVAHLDADGVLEVVIGSDLVYVIDGNCNERLDGDNNAQTFGPISSVGGKYEPASIALGDLTGDYRWEIVASDWDNQLVYAFDPDGNILPGWPVDPPSKNWGTPAIGDVDGDGDNEVVWVDTTGYINAFHHDGSEMFDGDSDPLTTGPIAPRRVGETFGRTSPALYDVDNDGLKEILFGSSFNSDTIVDLFYALKPDGTGNNAPGFPRVIGNRASFICSPTVADLDGDLSMEIMNISENDSLYIWNTDGSRYGNFPIYARSQAINRNSVAPSIAVGDFLGDADLEIVFVETLGATSSNVNLIDNTGADLPGWPVTVPNLSESSPIVGDITGDGFLDIVFGIGGGTDTAPNRLYAWNRDGTEVAGFPIVIAGFVRATPTLVDFNGDGNINIVMASWDSQLHVWDMLQPYDPLLVPYPTFRGHVSRDGVFRPRSLVAVPDPGELPQRAALRPNVPNPFNPSTRLSFDLPAGGGRDIRLDIYDAAGRHVRSLFRGPMNSGRQELEWNGRSDMGTPVASGVYFAHLRVDGRSVQTRKMALIK